MNRTLGLSAIHSQSSPIPHPPTYALDGCKQRPCDRCWQGNGLSKRLAARLCGTGQPGERNFYSEQCANLDKLAQNSVRDGNWLTYLPNAICWLLFYWNLLTRNSFFSNSHSDLAWIQNNLSDKFCRVTLSVLVKTITFLGTHKTNKTSERLGNDNSAKVIQNASKQKRYSIRYEPIRGLIPVYQ